MYEVFVKVFLLIFLRFYSFFQTSGESKKLKMLVHYVKQNFSKCTARHVRRNGSTERIFETLKNRRTSHSEQNIVARIRSAHFKICVWSPFHLTNIYENVTLIDTILHNVTVFIKPQDKISLLD